MDRQEIIERLAEYFEIEPDVDGNYNLNGYDWQAGCYTGRGDMWLTLANVVDALSD